MFTYIICYIICYYMLYVTYIICNNIRTIVSVVKSEELAVYIKGY